MLPLSQAPHDATLTVVRTLLFPVERLAVASASWCHHHPLTGPRRKAGNQIDNIRRQRVVISLPTC